VARGPWRGARGEGPVARGPWRGARGEGPVARGPWRWARGEGPVTPHFSEKRTLNPALKGNSEWPDLLIGDLLIGEGCQIHHQNLFIME